MGGKMTSKNAYVGLIWKWRKLQKMAKNGEKNGKQFRKTPYLRAATRARARARPQVHEGLEKKME